MTRIYWTHHVVASLLLVTSSNMGRGAEPDPKPAPPRKSLVLEVTFQSRLKFANPADLRNSVFMREIEIHDSSDDPQAARDDASQKIDLFNLRKIGDKVSVVISPGVSAEAELRDDHGKLLAKHATMEAFTLSGNQSVRVNTSGRGKPATYTLRISDQEHAPSVAPEAPALIENIHQWAGFATDGAGSVQAVGHPDNHAWIQKALIDGGSIAVPDKIQQAAFKRWPFIGPTQLVNLSGLKNLRHLDVSDSRIDDLSLVYLKDLRRLDTLNLSGTRITGEGLKYLTNLHSLTSLDISRTNIGDSSVAELKKLGRLRSINAVRSKITSEGLWELRWAVPGGMDDLDGRQVQQWGQYWGMLSGKAGTTTPQALSTSTAERDRELLQILVRGCSLRLSEAGDPVVAVMPTNDVRENLTFHPVEQNVHTIVLLSNFDTIERVVFQRQYPAIDECMVAELSGLHGLTSIDVHECWLTEAAWKRISQLSSLTSINYDQSLITNAMLETLHTALPRCKFEGTPTIVFHDDIRIHR